MAFPQGWPPVPPSGRRSFRVFTSGNATGNYSDNAFLFHLLGSNVEPVPVVKPGQPNSTEGDYGTANINQKTVVPPTPQGFNDYIYPATIRVYNDGSSELRISFDGTNDHGAVKAGEMGYYRNRYEGGIAVKGSGAFRIEAW